MKRKRDKQKKRNIKRKGYRRKWKLDEQVWLVVYRV